MISIYITMWPRYVLSECFYYLASESSPQFLDYFLLLKQTWGIPSSFIDVIIWYLWGNIRGENAFFVRENQYSCPLISPDLPARVPCQPPLLVITYSEACQCWFKLIRSFCLSLKLEYPETNVHSFLSSIKLINSIVTQCSRKCSFLESWNMHRLSVCLDYHQLVIAGRLQTRDWPLMFERANEQKKLQFYQR